MDSYHLINHEKLTFKEVFDIIKTNKKLKLSESAIDKIDRCRTYLDERMAKSDVPIYGVNTGFGALYNKKISREDLGHLQENLVMSHASGTGEEVPPEIVKLMLLLKIQSLSYGHSGVQVKTVQRLIDFYNHDIIGGLSAWIIGRFR